MSSASVSPTAHYTGHVWSRNALSHPALATPEGQVFYLALQPAVTVSKLLGGPSLEEFLLARHREIDRRLRAAVDAGRVRQVVEIAAGMSPRGWRFAQRYGDRITYIETDLPGMAARKRGALEQAGTLGEHHRVVELDALAEAGPQSLAGLAASLDRDGGLAIITEGLLSYLGEDSLHGLWRRITATLADFRDGVYLADLHLGEETASPLASAFIWALSTFVRSRVRLHFQTEADALAALHEAGFTSAELRRPPDSRYVRVIEASV